MGNGVAIPSDQVYFFGDRIENIPPFAKMGFNAREISCDSRDTRLYGGSGMVGFCGATPEEVVRKQGIYNCDDDRSGEGCHTAVEGEKCFQNVGWAMKTGIKRHPEWYPGLTASSNFEAFQLLLSKDRGTRCPEPCLTTTSVSTSTTTLGVTTASTSTATTTSATSTVSPILSSTT